MGIPSAVFISSNEDNTHGSWPVHDGLPTVEDHHWIPEDEHILLNGVKAGRSFVS